MKKVTLTLTALLMSSALAQADVITCVFTEPFAHSSYDLASGTLTYFGGRAGEQARRDIVGVEFMIKGAGSFELIEVASGKVIQKLELNNAGSDGMSDRVFPYSAEDTSGLVDGAGGCESVSLPAQGEG